MWRVIAAGSGTGTFFGLTLPLLVWFTTEAKKFLRSAKWLGADTLVNGSLEIVFRYQLKRAFPNSPREFLGCGDWFISTLTTGPTTRADRPRLGTGGITRVCLPLGPSSLLRGFVAFSKVTAMAYPFPASIGRIVKAEERNSPS